ncbi:MAG TPA: LysM peptidoglycan-binding domain-containing protein [Oscillospiraceae bacterium]|nr:LysM peptidoglycan-binding domain-containing protein [Oscillospiraceae bacterium]
MSCQDKSIKGLPADCMPQQECLDAMQIYRLTLETILKAMHKMLASLPQAEVPGATCRIPTSCPAGFTGRYTVQPGDSMFLIAQRCGVSLQSLINANPQITDPSQIFPCDVLCVPLQCANQDSLPGSTTCRIPGACPVGFTGRYTVQPGDSMFLIAQRCGISLQSLINANPQITDPGQLVPCDVLCVPLQCANQGTCRMPTSCPAGFPGRYTVQPGDSMFLIAQRCGISLQSLINANPQITDPGQLVPCDVLCVPPQCAN